MADVALVEQRLRQGLFFAAADAVRPLDSSQAGDPWRLALAAEAYERTGRAAEATVAVADVCRRGPAATRALARALIVRGVLELERGQAEDSIVTLERSQQVASQAGSPAEVCWSQLRLLLSRFDAEPSLDLDAAVANTRVGVERFGEANAAIALHVFASEAYAKRGVLAPARRHLATAQDLLRFTENPWLGGLVAIGGFCLSYLEMDYTAAENAAKQALRLSRISGHLRSEFAAIIDLAHVWMQFGRLDDAGRMLRRASNMCDLSPRCRDCVRDGLAQLESRRGNLGSSRHLVDEVLASSPRHAYPRVWGALTKAEMLLRQGLYQECQAQCEAALAALPEPTDRGLALRLRLILSEVLAQSGAFPEAGRVAVRARQDAANSSLGMLAELNHRLANVLSLGGLELQAEALEDRARRLAAPAVKRPVAGGARRLAAGQDGGLEPPGRGGDGRTRVLDRTAAIFEQAGRPELAAAEMGRLLDDLDCCARWAVVQESGVRAVIVEGSGPMSPSDVRDLLQDPGVFRIDLFDRGGQRFSMLAEPRPSIAATESLAAVMRLARHCVSLEGGGVPLRLEADRAPGLEIAMSGIAEALHMARRVADSDVPVLLLGETGVGKEWLARRIHEWSRRARSRFVGFNCAAVSREMMEAQLFGHRKGAFTGAVEGSAGVIRGADGGTVLLDEIGDVPVDCQVKLLRFLETGEVHGVGEVLPSPTNVRVLAATNRRLEDLTAAGVMRPDLFYRLSVVRIEIPPLRQRREEIVPLAVDALHRFAGEFRKGPLRLSDACREVLMAYDWPGNVRQLINELRRAVALAAPGDIITPRDLSPEIGDTPPPRAASPAHVTIELDQSLADATVELERASIVRALELCDGRRDQAAALLGLSRKGLYLKCQRLNIALPDAGVPGEGLRPPEDED